MSFQATYIDLTRDHQVSYTNSTLKFKYAYFVMCLKYGDFVNGSFQAPSQNVGERLLDYSCLSVSPSVRMEQLGSQWIDFHEI